MPKLLLFAPCDRVIIDEAGKTLTLISILEQVQSQTPPMGEKVAGAVNWFAIALYLQLPEDEGKTYEQRTCLMLPDGSETLEGTISFQMTQRTHRVMARMFGFPISQTGECSLRLALREKDKGEQWHTIAEYPIRVVHMGVSMSDTIHVD